MKTLFVSLAAIILLICSIPAVADDTIPTPESITTQLRYNHIRDSLRIEALKAEHEQQIMAMYPNSHKGNQDQGEPFTILLLQMTIPIITIIGIVFLVWHNINSKRTLSAAMIEKGINPLQSSENTGRFASLRIGLLLLGLGFGLIVGTIFVPMMESLHPTTSMLLVVALCMFFGGLGLVLNTAIVRRFEQHS